MLKELFPGSTDFTAAIFKIPNDQNIFWLCFPLIHCQCCIHTQDMKRTSIYGFHKIANHLGCVLR